MTTVRLEATSSRMAAADPPVTLPGRNGNGARTPIGRLSVRRSVVLVLCLLLAIAAAAFVINLQAIASAAFMLRRAEISYGQLSAYQQLSIDVLEFMIRRPGQAAPQRRSIAEGLATIDGLTTAETVLVRDHGGNEGNEEERARLSHVRSLVTVLLASGRSPSQDVSAAATYTDQLKPLMVAAIGEERTEIDSVERAMQGLQARMRWLGPVGILFQVLTVGLLLALVGRLVLAPISRLVADIQVYGRGSLAHRVDIRRHDEFGLLAQHINRMARRLERGRSALVSSNVHLEAVVAERTSSLLEKNRELHDIDESRRRFFADVSHELRTPLTAIVGEADVTLRYAAADTDALRGALSSILANSTYLNRRIDDLMALARSSDGRINLEREAIDLNVIATDAIAEIRSLARVNRVSARFDPLGWPVLVRGDRARLRQCLMILLDNAVKFSRACQTIEVVLEDRGTQAGISVVDRGRGIAIKELPRVFERFYQTEVGRRMGGTGLGLSIARRIIEAHDGEIAADLNDAGGTTVTITLPILNGTDT